MVLFAHPSLPKTDLEFYEIYAPNEHMPKKSERSFEHMLMTP